MKTLEERSKELDKQRQEALETRTSIAYYKLCAEQGITSEDQLLYEQGCLESKDSNSDSQDLNVRKFLNEVKRLNLSNYFFDASGKKKLLVKYFPNKFGPGGKQDLNSDKYKNDGKIGKLFESLVINYLKKV